MKTLKFTRETKEAFSVKDWHFDDDLTTGSKLSDIVNRIINDRIAYIFSNDENAASCNMEFSLVSAKSGSIDFEVLIRINEKAVIETRLSLRHLLDDLIEMIELYEEGHEAAIKELARAIKLIERKRGNVIGGADD